jgi:hypothetical protein
MGSLPGWNYLSAGHGAPLDRLAPSVIDREGQASVRTTEAATACVPSATTLCLNQNRFEVRIGFTTPGNTNGNGKGTEFTTDAGFFTFFDPNNLEVLVKVLDACGVNQSYWVFAGGLTNVATRLRVRDTESGVVKTYRNPQGKDFVPLADTAAFSCL